MYDFVVVVHVLPVLFVYVHELLVNVAEYFYHVVFLAKLKKIKFKIHFFLQNKNIFTVAPNRMASSRLAVRLSLSENPLIPKLKTSWRAFSRSNSFGSSFFFFDC